MIVLWLLACWPDYPTDWDGDGWDAPEDCDPTDPAVSPGAQEIWYDGFDQDCDGADDFDADGDGWPVDQDCKDDDAEVNPGATEIWYDDVDQDCAGDSDHDADGDGALFDDDCDDAEATVHPGATEVWYDGVDQDCDGWSDHDADRDGHDVPDDCDDTTELAHPGLAEVCDDGLDNDCDGTSNDCTWDSELGLEDTTVTVWGEADSWFGEALAAGDVDGDGFGDLLVGGSRAGDGDEGAAWLIRGPLVEDQDLASIDWGSEDTDLLALRGYEGNQWAGGVLALADVDGDGLLEGLMGLPRANQGYPSGGVVFARLERTGEAVLDVDDDAWLLGPGYQAELLGTAVVPDGLGGLWVGASGSEEDWEPNQTSFGTYGSLYHLQAMPTEDTNLERVTALTRYVAEEQDGAGFTLALVGDLDGDGTPELAIGAPGCPNPSWSAYPGCVYILPGGAPGGPHDLVNEATHRLYGRAEQARTGYTMAGAGDVDGDGLDDVLVGAPFENSASNDVGQAGAAYLLTSATLRDDGPKGRSIDQSLWSIADARFVGNGHGTHIADGLGTLGDVDGDGFADVAIHAYDPTATASVVHVLYGPVTGERTLADDHGAPVQKDVLIRGNEAGGADLTGHAYDGRFDLTGDGVPDLVFTDPIEPGSGSDLDGALYLLPGAGL